MDKAQYDEMDVQFLKWWRKFTNSKPLSADDLLAIKEGRTLKLIEHCGYLGVPVKSGNVQKYRRQHALLKDKGFDTSVVVTPPTDWMRKRAFISDFPKVEFLPEGKFTRAISPPDPGWNFIMAQFSCAAEKNFYSLMDSDVNVGVLDWFPHSVGPLIGKAYNSMERAQILDRKWKHLQQVSGERVVCSSTDCEGFDSHHRKFFINAEGELMAKMFVDHKRWLRKVWKNVTVSRGGCDYYFFETDGGRDSGHMWTGWGNCYAIIKHLRKSAKRLVALGIPKEKLFFDVFSDGDDCLILMTETLYEIVTSTIRGVFAEAGHVVKFEQKAESIFDVVWCQSKVVEVEDESGSPAYKFVHNPFKMLKVLGSMVNMGSTKEAEKYIGDVLYAYSVLNRGIPIYKDLVRICPPQHKHELSPETGLVLELAREASAKYSVTSRTYKTFVEAWTEPGIVEAIESEIAEVVRSHGGWVNQSFVETSNTTQTVNSSSLLSLIGRLAGVVGPTKGDS
jgi:hypothetical protein